jgi:signal peptidase II
MLYFAISFVLLLLDQASKQYMSSILPLCQPGYCQSIEILPIFKLTVVHNEGAAFSFLSDAGGWQRWLLVSISIFASLFVAVWLYRVSRQEKLLALALAFILGGALGNLVDRALLGYVVDFIVVYYESYYLPAFNIADSAITIGAGFLILDMFINYRKGVDE